MAKLDEVSTHITAIYFKGADHIYIRNDRIGAGRDVYTTSHRLEWQNKEDFSTIDEAIDWILQGANYDQR